MPLPSRDFIERASKAIRQSESDRVAAGHGQASGPGGYGGLHVRVKGPPVVVVATTTTTGTGTTVTSATSTTTSSTATTCPTTSSSTTTSGTSTTPGPVYLYPAVFVYRDIDTITKKEWWFEGEPCWAQETHNEGLGLDCVYPGQLAGEYMGLAIIGVRGNGTNLPCSTTDQGTTTSGGCVGVCDWDYDLPSHSWVSSSNDCCPPGACGCPQPDFCPPDESCANTQTYCATGADPEITLVNCGPTSTGTSGTTTTPDPAGCGSGCTWKHVPGVGMVAVTIDCHPGVVLADGSICVGCPGIPPGVVECGTVTSACQTVPPPPGCGGSCLWVWPDVPGGWWIQDWTQGGCRGGTGACNCKSPTQPGSACGHRTATPCLEPGAPSTTNTGTTTTRGGCLDSCVLGWDTGLSGWAVLESCGPNCDCEQPTYDGVDDCTIARTPCKPTTATSTTTSGTTTTSDCSSQPCQMICDGSAWTLFSPCSSENCFCPEPGDPCGPGFEGATVDQFCVGGTTGTTSTTTVTTPTTPPPCCGLTDACVYKCGFEGFRIDPATGQPVPVYAWAVCRNNCTGLTGDCCPPPLLGPCNSNTAGNCVAGNCRSSCIGGAGPDSGLDSAGDGLTGVF